MKAIEDIMQYQHSQRQKKKFETNLESIQHDIRVLEIDLDQNPSLQLDIGGIKSAIADLTEELERFKIKQPHLVKQYGL